ncbi:MAG: rRNA adenine N-6-methyltransferase family protein [Bacteroidota bacterium]|nr:rRNA adenine N-6-methyltransferase family protein [Bacteroidota bacterium]
METGLVKIFTKEVQEFIHKHKNGSVQELALTFSHRKDLPIKFILEQIDGYQRIKNKLPSWSNNNKIIFPAKLNLEQSSSELTAKYKSEILNVSSIIDITGGLGVDTFYFSKNCRSVTYIEQNKELFEIAVNNFMVLGTKNIQTTNQDGIDFLKANKTIYDLIYIDPARRDIINRKMVSLNDCVPNVVLNQELFFSKSKRIMIKASPMLDISAAISELQFVKEVHIVSVKNECKEVIYIQELDYNHEPLIIAINIKSENYLEQFTFTKAEESEALAIFGFHSKWLYEPNASVMKSGAFNIISSRYDILKMASNTHLYTSNELKMDFPGNIYEIQDVFKWGDNQANAKYKGLKMNIKTFNFPWSVDEIKKQMKLKDGGELYLFGCTDFENIKIGILATKQKP